jgi:phage terminase large subunit-like protein
MEATPKASSASKRRGRRPRDPHVAAALGYARDVVAGRVPACEYVRQACQRQLDDLERFDGDPLYQWSEPHAGRVCRFVELLPHIKGPLAGERLRLEPWQCFVLTTAFGWRRRDTGGRRFRRAMIEVPRGQGKSALASAIALYGLAADGEAGAEVYSAATTSQQARIVFDVAKAMIRKRPSLVDTLGLVVREHVIAQPKTNSVFVPLSREAGTKDGANLHMAVIDELHAHKRRDMYDVLETAMSKRLASLLWMITTAGEDTAGICYELRSYAMQVLAGTVTDETYFATIYTLDEADDPAEPIKSGDLATWRKANPNWGVSVQPDEFVAAARKAYALRGAAWGNFLRKHLGVWTTEGARWMPPAAWDACADPNLTEEQFTRADPCTIGLDLASKIDIAAKVKLYWRDLPRASGEGSERHYYAFLRAYLPDAAVDEARHASYQSWRDLGYIETTPGDVLDFEVIKDGLRSDRDTGAVQSVAYDPFQATQLSSEMIAEGFPMVEVAKTFREYSAPMKEILALVLGGRLHHDGNPVFRWMIGNVIERQDNKGNVFPRKDRPEDKIDAADALIMALSRAMLAVPTADPYAIGGPGLMFV